MLTDLNYYCAVVEPCSCKNCNWMGNNSQLLPHSTTIESAGGTTYLVDLVCPLCGNNDIHFTDYTPPEIHLT